MNELATTVLLASGAPTGDWLRRRGPDWSFVRPGGPPIDGASDEFGPSVRSHDAASRIADAQGDDRRAGAPDGHDRRLAESNESTTLSPRRAKAAR